MDSRERVTRILNLEEPDVIAVLDFPWTETVNRWRKEGFPLAGVEPSDYFGFDTTYIYVESASPRYESFVYEETDRLVTRVDKWGSLTKGWKAKSGVPVVLQPSVQSLEEFREQVEPFIDINDPRRVSSPNFPFRKELEEGIRNLQKKYFVFIKFLDPFESARHLMGTERLCVDFLRDPDFISYIFNVFADFYAECGKCWIDAGVDGLWIGGDLAYRNGPFFSPQLYRKILAPAHRKMISPFRKRGLPVVEHTDGDIRLLIPDLLTSGVTALNPLEAKAGMDVRELKERYGDRLAFIGNIDTRALSGSLEDVKKEVLSKLPIACEGGGYILSSDHSVPPTVPLRNFEYMLKLGRKYGRYTF